MFITISLFAKESFLNQKERNWIKAQKPITIGITEIPNQILVTKNGYKGFSIDLFNLISKETGLKFKYIYFDTWNKVIQAAKNKKIDVIFLAQKTKSRLSYLRFTDTVLIQQNKIIVNINKEYKNIKELENKKVAITRGSAIEEFLEYNYPSIKLITTNSELQSLQLVNQNKADATIVESVRASYYINKYNLDNLLITNNINYNYYLRIASRDDKKMLNIVLTKAVDNLHKEIKALQLKWGYAKDKVVFFDTKTMIFISIIFVIILAFSFYMYTINLRLKKEINEKNEALKRIKLMRDSRLTQMSEILSMISHQWKQPLNNLSLMHQIVLMKYYDNELDDNTIKEFELHSKQQIDLMTQTIDDFREFFRVDEKRQIFDVKKVVEEAVLMVKPAFNQNNINTYMNFENKEYLSKGYPRALQQIIINILNNAKDALSEIKEEKKVIISLKDDKNIVLAIEDNAGGIPIEIIDKIFNPYFSTKKDKDGTGLGLYMAKIIVEEKMKGSIDVKNSEDGAVFEIKLPKA